MAVPFGEIPLELGPATVAQFFCCTDGMRGALPLEMVPHRREDVSDSVFSMLSAIRW